MAFEHRLKLFLDENRRLVVGILVLAGVLALVGAGYVYLSPNVETVTEQTDVQTFETDVESSALVTRPTPLYQEGERLTNRSTYFLSATPSLTLTSNTSVPADASVVLNQTLSLEILGVRDGRPFYRSTRTLIEANRTIEDGQLTVSTTTNVSEIRQRLQTLQTETEGVGSFQLRLQHNVHYRTEQYSGTLEQTVPFVITGQAYYIDGTLQIAETEDTTVQRQVRRAPSPTAYGSLIFLGGFMFVGALYAGRLGQQVDREELRTQIVHDRHTEWISRGQIPTNSERQYIQILTLEDLVDVAIDTNRRVIYDPQINAYAVTDSTEIYYYALDEMQADEWLDI